MLCGIEPVRTLPRPLVKTLPSCPDRGRHSAVDAPDSNQDGRPQGSKRCVTRTMGARVPSAPKRAEDATRADLNEVRHDGPASFDAAEARLPLPAANAGTGAISLQGTPKSARVSGGRSAMP